jgi:DNA-binding LacI/PurR family transcriptional regulator
MATILDVAKVSGMSKTTVSRAFVNPGAVKPSTLKKINLAAKSLNYQPNALARAMITKKTENIGFIIYDRQYPIITNPFYGPILESVVEEIGQKGYSLFISSDKGLRNKSGEIMLRKQVDGVILASQTDRKVIKSFIKAGTPVVLINYHIKAAGIYSILSDDFGGIMDAVSYLAGAGHRDVGFIEGRFTQFISSRRHEAFLRAMEKNNLVIRPGFMALTEPSIKDAFDAACRMFSLKKHPSALVCANDVIAVGAAKAALHRGLKIPEDISITGYDNSDLCAACQPALTSIDANTRELGIQAVHCLLCQMSGRLPVERTITVGTRLVIRESTGRKRADRFQS